MNYEKKYKEALANARQEYTTTENVERKRWLEELFPELKESEDEKIRKTIIDFVNEYGDKFFSTLAKGNAIAWLKKQGNSTVDVDKMVLKYSQTRETCTNGLPVNCQIRAYRQGINDILEKQGEKKSTDMVKPKFKVGDWVASNSCTGHILHIIDIDNRDYEIEIPQGNTGVPTIAYIDNNFHLWSIQDAIDGDVLASDNSIFIFQEEYIAEKPIAYCGLMNGLFVKGEDACWTNEKCYPATKEQRELLFKRIKAAGYEWDAEKKELKIIDWSKHIKYEPDSPSIIEQKPVWSDEDDAYKEFAISAVEDFYDEENTLQKELVDWLKSFKDRVQHKPKEWNDEDEKIRNILIRICINALPDIFKRYGYEGDKKNIIAWLEKQAV